MAAKKYFVQNKVGLLFKCGYDVRASLLVVSLAVVTDFEAFKEKINLTSQSNSFIKDLTNHNLNIKSY